MIEASPDNGRLSRRDVLKAGMKIGIGAMAVGAGLTSNEAEARNHTPEEQETMREAMQSEMRHLVNQAVHYFQHFDHQYKDSLYNGIADEVRKFNKVAGGELLERNPADKYYDGLDKRFEDVFSKTLYVGSVERKALDLIEYIQALLKTIDVSLLAWSSDSEVKKERNELNESLTTTSKKLEELWRQWIKE